MTPLSPLAQQTAARTHATAPWRTWCCPLHLMGGFSPDRDARRGWLASAPGAADAAALPSFSDQTPKTRSAMCTADAALTAGLVQRLDADRVLVFRNARVLTMRGWQALPAHDVWVRHGRIEAVQPTGGALPEHALVVDASGKTLMPGLSDIHAHPFTATWAQAFAGMVQGGGDGQWYVLPYALQLWELLACGITRIEVMAARPARVQIGWLGFPGTTGADFIDYLIGDAVVTPPDPISQLMLAVPLVLLYEISIWCVRLIEMRRKTADAAA